MQIDDPDVRLMLAFRNGDESALSDLYGRWARPLLRYLDRMMRETGAAEELVQETFIRVYNARDRYSPDARFSTWLFRIGRNLALNELNRAHRRMPHLSTDTGHSTHTANTGFTTIKAGGRGASLDSTHAEVTLVSKVASIESTIDFRRRADRLESELANLPERQRSALWLAVVEGYAYQEIAVILETSVPSVKSLVHRARASLADRMTDSVQSATEAVK